VGKGHKEQPSSESPQQVPTLTDRTFAGVIATANDQVMQFHEEKVYRIYGPTFSMAFPARNEESHLLIPDRFLPARTAVAVLLYRTPLYRLLQRVYDIYQNSLQYCIIFSSSRAARETNLCSLLRMSCF
jgi:hypothetical protein